ncbi:MAG: serine hydrolase [bacterium]
MKKIIELKKTEELENYLSNLTKTQKIDFGIYVRDKSNILFRYKENEIFPAASLVKVPLAALILKKIQEGNLKLTQSIKIDSKVPGAGIIKDLSIKRYKLIDLITLTLIMSDNTASNTLINLTSFDEINNFIKNLGFKNTCIKRKFMVDLISPPVNFTTAYEMTEIFYKLLNDEILNFKNKILFFEILSKQHFQEKIPKLIKKDTIVCNKTGDIEGISHDSAVIFKEKSIKNGIKKGDYLIITILTSFSKEVERDFVNKIIGEVALKMYSNWVKGE